MGCFLLFLAIPSPQSPKHYQTLDFGFCHLWTGVTFPFFPQDAGGQQIGFLLGSCGIALALTTEVCLKGLPKTQNGEIVQFKGELVIDWLLIVLQLKGAVRTLKALLEGKGAIPDPTTEMLQDLCLWWDPAMCLTQLLWYSGGSQGTTSQAQVPSFGRFQGSFIHKLYLGMLQGSSLRRGNTLLPTELPDEQRDEPSGW